MAGGEGSRLRPLTINRPKPMVSIVNKPCLGHIFDLLKRHGIEDAFVTLQYLASVIQDFGSAEPHDAYEAKLRREHGRKSSFWHLVG